MSIDWRALWNFDDPAETEARFREALTRANQAEAALLTTQIARTWGLRGDFAQARQVLTGASADRDRFGGEAAVRWWLEWGRTYASAAHRPDQMAESDREEARRAYDLAFEAAREAGLGGLAADALHMQAFTDPAPQGQEAANRRALEFVLSSDDPEARGWEPALRNNLGMALHGRGDFTGALREFEAALVLRRAEGAGSAERVARWMVAWTLRHLGRLAEALAAQKALEADCAAAGEPDPYVFEELETLHRALGEDSEAARYADLRKTTGS